MLARNFVTTSTSIVFRMVLSFVAGVMLARFLGPELRGIYALALLIPQTVFSFANLGLGTANVVYAGKEPEKRGVIAFQSFAFAAIIGLAVLVFYVIVFCTKPAWFNRFLVVGESNLILASSLVFLQLIHLYLRSGITGANRIIVINIEEVIFSVSQALLIFILIVVLGLGVSGGIIVQLACFAIVVVYFTIMTAVKVPLSTWKPDFSFFKKSLLLGIQVYLNSMAWFVASLIDRYFIVYMMPNSDKELGYYSVSAQIAQTLWILPQTMQAIFLPHLSITQANRGILTARVTRLLFVILLPVLAALGIGSRFIPVVLGSEYQRSVMPFVWFLPGMFLFGATRPMDSFLTHKEKPLYGAVNGWVGAIANMILNSYFIPRMGIDGAALASSLSVMLMAVITVGCFKYESKVDFKYFLIKISDFKDLFSISVSLMRKLVLTVKRRP